MTKSPSMRMEPLLRIVMVAAAMNPPRGGPGPGGCVRPAPGNQRSVYTPRSAAGTNLRRRRALPLQDIEARTPMAHQYIFTMKDLRKVYPPNREVLKGI